MYAIVAFADNSSELVPKSWLTNGGKQCYWPPNDKALNMMSYVKSQKPPKSNWLPLEIRILSLSGLYSLIFLSLNM